MANPGIRICNIALEFSEAQAHMTGSSPESFGMPRPIGSTFSAMLDELDCRMNCSVRFSLPPFLHVPCPCYPKLIYGLLQGHKPKDTHASRVQEAAWHLRAGSEIMGPREILFRAADKVPIAELSATPCQRSLVTLTAICNKHEALDQLVGRVAARHGSKFYIV